MRFIKVIILSLCGLLLLSSCGRVIFDSKSKLQEAQEQKIIKYEQEVANFRKVSSQELFDVTGNEEKFIYFGKKECKYCRRFVPKLKNVFEQKKIMVNYLDTGALSEEVKKELLNKYQIQEVPTLIYVDKKQNFNYYDENEIRLDDWVDQQLKS
ncbi:thioredoxin fold domain-containing protein [Enterococcus faecalis]|nr:thioredoxin fold domain-containing protein [Enterococcus faecalis]